MNYKTIGTLALAGTFAFGTSTAWAQRSASGGSSEGRSAGSAPVVGTAVPRGGGDSGGGTAGSTSPSSGSSDSVSGASSQPFTPSRPSSTQSLAFAPQRRGVGGGAGSTGGHAVPRGSSEGGSGSTSSRAPSSTPSASSGGERRAVPSYSRPREDRPVRGYATERGSVDMRPGSGYPSGYPYTYYNSYYYPYGYYPYRYYPYGYYGLGFGLGFGLYDPFWNPGYSYYGGFAPMYGAGGYGGYGYDEGYYGGGGGGSPQSYDTGSLRLKIKPREAQVFVDGYLVGDVDQFDGVFQKLSIDAGGHSVEVKAEGYQPEKFDVMITPNETVTYKGELKPSVK